jgi:threonine/homoserine/homoserine lactone efflux protein
MLIYLVQGLGYGLAAAAQPGPFQTYLVAQALNQGWRRTLPAALAPLVSDGPIIALVLLALSQVPAWFQRFLYLAGGAFILYLAWNAYCGWRAGHTETPAGGGGSLWRAALTNVLSPGPYLYWSLVTGPILLEGWRRAPGDGAAFLAGFYLAMVGSLAGLISLFADARQLGPHVNRALLSVSALALLGFGLYQLWRGLSSG